MTSEKSEQRIIGWSQLIIAIITIALSVVGTGVTTGVVVTRYLGDLEKNQAILDGRVSAIEKYGTLQANEALKEAAGAKTAASLVAVQRASDMAIITTQLEGIKSLIVSNNTVFSAAISDIKTELKEHIKETTIK
jgi:hypothetical protein